MRSLFVCVLVLGSAAAIAVGCSSSSEVSDSFSMPSPKHHPDAGVTGPAPQAAPSTDPPVAPQGQPGGCVVVRVGAQSSASGPESGFAAAPTAGPRIIYLNKNGGTYYPGNGIDNSSSNRSSLVSQTVTMPPYSRSAADWAQLMALTKQTYAPFNVVVTDQDPGAAPHVEVVVSGHPSMIGQPSSAAGISPLTGDCSVIERAVVFAFDQLLQGPDDQARVVTHEAGHAFGLDHELYCPDLMSYLFDCAWPKHFIDQTVACGEYSARACNCGGSQDSVQHLFTALGKNQGMGAMDAGTTTGMDAGTTTTSQLAVTLGTPADGASVPGNAPLALSAAVTGGTPSKVYLEWEMPSGTVEVDCDAPQTGTTCTKNNGMYTFSFTAGTGARAWSVRATDGGGASTTSTRRTLTLTDGAAMPVVTISSPAAGDTYAPGETVSLRVDATAAAGVSQVWLTWTAPSGSTQYPLSQLGGTMWGLDVPISTTAVNGPRALRITAYDPQNLAGSKDVSIQVQQ